MNHMMVNEETDIQYYRLRTARQRKRMARKGFENKLRALDREEAALWRKKRNLGWIELNPPVQRGWNRYFILREDVARSRHEGFFQGILNKINTIHWSNSKDFRVKRRRYKKDSLVERKQELLQPSERHFNKLTFSDTEEQFFYEKYVVEKGTGRLEKVFAFGEPWRFVLKVKPNLITKTRVRDEAIESRQKEISNYFERNNLRSTVTKLKAGWYRYRWCRKEYCDYREAYEFKNIPLPQILDNIREY